MTDIEIDEAYHMVSDPRDAQPEPENVEGPAADHEAAKKAMDALLSEGDSK